MGGSVETVRCLLELGASVNSATWGGDTPLHWAASDGALQIAKLLLDKEADPNIRTTFGRRTPLWGAAARGHPTLMVLLLERGGDPTLPDKDGVDPQGAASLAGHPACAELLARRALLADPERVDRVLAVYPLGAGAEAARSALDAYATARQALLARASQLEEDAAATARAEAERATAEAARREAETTVRRKVASVEARVAEARAGRKWAEAKRLSAELEGLHAQHAAAWGAGGGDGGGGGAAVPPSGLEAAIIAKLEGAARAPEAITAARTALVADIAALRKATRAMLYAEAPDDPITLLEAGAAYTAHAALAGEAGDYDVAIVCDEAAAEIAPLLERLSTIWEGDRELDAAVG